MDINFEYLVERALGKVETPQFCTVALEEFLKKYGCFREGTEILDIGCNIGIPIHYYYKKNPKCRFLGIDYSEQMIVYAKKIKKSFSRNK